MFLEIFLYFFSTAAMSADTVERIRKQALMCITVSALVMVLPLSIAFGFLFMTTPNKLLTLLIFSLATLAILYTQIRLWTAQARNSAFASSFAVGGLTVTGVIIESMKWPPDTKELNIICIGLLLVIDVLTLIEYALMEPSDRPKLLRFKP